MRTAIVFLMLAACAGDETISGYADPDAEYRLSEIDRASFPAMATIRFPAVGRIEGDAPCNSYTARQSVPYPWFSAGNLVATDRGCAALADEAAFFDALLAMTLAEVQGGTLILSNEAGREMVFRAAQP